MANTSLAPPIEQIIGVRFTAQGQATGWLYVHDLEPGANNDAAELLFRIRSARLSRRIALANPDEHGCSLSAMNKADREVDGLMRQRGIHLFCAGPRPFNSGWPGYDEQHAHAGYIADLEWLAPPCI